MKWSTDKPKHPGWYWYKREPMVRYDATGIRPCILYVYGAIGGMFVEFANGDLGKIDVMGGEWSTEPIKEPEE